MLRSIPNSKVAEINATIQDCLRKVILLDSALDKGEISPIEAIIEEERITKIVDAKTMELMAAGANI